MINYSIFRPLLISVLFLCSCTENLQGDLHGLSESTDHLFAEINNTDSPGAAVAVVKDGKVLLSKGYGMANLEHKVPVTPSTVFDSASVSKQFTGMAIAMLLEEGKISLEEDVRKFIPELPDFGQTITVAHLLHHTSGLRDWPATLALAGWNMEDVISFEQILTMAYNQQSLNFEPGSEYVYSNTGYNLLAEVVARVTGKSFREWTDENIFQPLEMNDSHFRDSHTEIVPKMAYGYSGDGNGNFRTAKNSLTAFGSSSLYTTVDDLAKWVINLDKKEVGGEQVINAMYEQGVLNNGEENSYGFGLNNGEYRGLRTVRHSGGWAGFRTLLVHFPEQRFSIVVLMNHGPSDPFSIAYRIADIVLAADLHAEEENSEAVPEPVVVADSILDEYVGIYKLGAGWYVTINRSGNGLTSYATAEEVVPMTAQSVSTFWVEAYNSSIEFARDKTGRVSHFLYRGLTCEKLEKLRPYGPEELAELAGEYTSKELKTSYTILVDDGKLIAEHPRHGRIELSQTYGNDFSGSWFMRSVEFFRDGQGEIAGLKVSQARSRRQLFERQKGVPR